MKSTCEVERLNSIRNEMTHLWGGVFATAGGSIALFISEPTFIKCMIAFVGILFAVVMANAYLIRRNEIVKIIESLEE